MTAGLHLSRRLEQLLPGVIGKRYRKLLFSEGEIVPTLADLEVGAKEVVRERVGETGTARLLANNANDIPLVNLDLGEDKYPVFMIAAGLGYSFQDMRSIQKAGNANMISSRRISAANRVIEERDNKFAAFGDTALGLTGFVNNAAVTANSTTFNPYTATPDQLADFFMDEISPVVRSSNSAEIPGDVIVSIDFDLLISSKRMTDGNSTVKQYVLQNNDYVRSIRGVPEVGFQFLEDNGVLAGGTNKDRVIFYPFERLPQEMTDEQGLADMVTPEVCERHIEPLQQFPVEWHERRDGRYIVPFFKCSTPSIINYPSAMRYTDILKRS